MTVWYDEPETFEERQSRTDRMGFDTAQHSLPFDRVVERARSIVLPHTRRPPRGIAMPFGLPYPDSFQWRLSPDIREVLLREWPTSLAVAALPVETLFGAVIQVDYTAPEGTIELVEKA